MFWRRSSARYSGVSPAPQLQRAQGRRRPQPRHRGHLPLRPPAPRHRRAGQAAPLRAVGVPEYLLLDLPCPDTFYLFKIRGYRLGPDRRYQPIEPDAEGRLLSETTDLLFGVSPEGDRIEVFDARTGERLLSPREAEEAANKELERLRAGGSRIDCLG
jgi:hypothetical protein